MVFLRSCWHAAAVHLCASQYCSDARPRWLRQLPSSHEWSWQYVWPVSRRLTQRVPPRLVAGHCVLWSVVRVVSLLDCP